jgi:SP family facilitated glucose transporter-like MFS transporter 8
VLHRAFVGLSVGIYFGLVPLYLREITPPDLRDTVGTFHQLGISMGGLFCYLFGAFVSWRRLAMAMAILPALQLCAIGSVPDSPLDKSSQRQATGEPARPRTRTKVFNIAFLKSIGFLFCLFALQQVSGIGPIQTNMSSLVTSWYGPTIAASSKVFAGFVAAYVLAKLKRGLTWFISLIGCAICLFLVSQGLQNKTDLTVLMGTFGYLFMFCLGFGPVPWTVLPAFFNDDVRSVASSFLATANSSMTFLMTWLWRRLTERFGQAELFGWLGAIVLCGSVMGFWFPETDVLRPLPPNKD